jgi:alpha-beta hydrolase superfamily lysophospholipase
VEPAFYLYGASLGGFEVGIDNSSNGDDDYDGKNQRESQLYDLEQQIHFVERKLEAFITANNSGFSTISDSKRTNNVSHRPRVILIGHSVGAYIAMEILRRHREESSSPAFDIIGGILLFPTVMDIASSPAGRKLTVCLACLYSPLIVL